MTSGGVESGALLMESLRRYERVYPIYVQKGLRWETAELSHLRKLLGAMGSDGLAKLTVLEIPLKLVYGAHWSLGGPGTPSSKAPDAAVYLPGRNLLLLSLASLFCTVRRIPVLWLGILKGNPFHDARSSFLRQIEGMAEETLGFRLRIAAPLRELTKAEVITRWADVPWEKTFSCLTPVRKLHCGSCQKCKERRSGFKEAGVSDPTRYAR